MAVVKWILVLLCAVGLAIGLVQYYPFIFARDVQGVVTDVQRIESANAILSRIGKGTPNDLSFLYSFAIAIKENSGEIVTASSEDRQWSVVKAGQCVEARYFPYPPWDLQKSGTYYGARLLKLTECKPAQ